MRVLQINTERTWRGGERQTLYTIEGLIEAGVEVGLVCRDGCPLDRAVKGMPVIVYPASSTLNAIQITAHIARKYDLVHAQSAKGQSIAVISRPLHRKPVLYTRRVNFKSRGAVSYLKYLGTTRVVAISTAIRDTLNSFGVKNVELISSAVKLKELDLDRARNLINTVNVPDGTAIIGWIGDLVPQKDPRLLVETIRELAGRRQDFVLIQCGRDQMGDVVNEGIEKYGLEDHFRMLGQIIDVEDIFSRFDVFLVTGNDTEGLNSSVYDAFAYEVPVVSTLSGGMRDSVADRGLTCEKRDPVCLADNIERLLDDADLAARMTIHARKWALERVTIPAITERYLAVYNDLLK